MKPVLSSNLGGGEEKIWSRLQTQQAAIDMATTVAKYVFKHYFDLMLAFPPQYSNTCLIKINLITVKPELTTTSK